MHTKFDIYVFIITIWHILELIYHDFIEKV
jgi:hypothetical protein